MNEELTKEQSDTMLKLALKIKALGIRASFNKVEPGPIITGFYFKPDADQPLAKIEKHEEDFALAADQDVVNITRKRGDVIIFVPNKVRKDVDFKDALYWAVQQNIEDIYSTDISGIPRNNIPILLGVDHLGTKRAIDLTTCPHILMGGSTGSGKSTFQSAVICTIAVLRDPAEVAIYLIDTKKLDLPLFKNLPHVLQCADDIAAARTIFLDLLDLTRKRYELFQMEQVRNVREYNKKTGAVIPYRLLIIDELADLLALDKTYCEIVEDAKPIKRILQELSQIARAAGTHIIAGTQRPDVKVIDGNTKNNFPTRIALKMTTRFDSQTILGENGAEHLLGKGDMWLKHTESPVLERYHGPYVKLDDIEQIVNNLDAVKQSLSFVR